VANERSCDGYSNLAHPSSHVRKTHGLRINDTVVLLSLLWMSLNDLSRSHYRFQFGRSKNNILDMVFGSGKKTFETMSHADTYSDVESQTQRDLQYPQGTIAKRIKMGREMWNSCHSWDHAMKLNRQFFSGELEVKIF
jgi:hypothetical protein